MLDRLCLELLRVHVVGHLEDDLVVYGEPHVLREPGVVHALDRPLEDVRGGQNRAQPGDVELMFIHESADGFANPLS